jgi:hypothetical protein
MGLISFIRTTTTLARYRRLQEQLTANRESGLNDIQASALLIIDGWRLPRTEPILDRTVALAMNLREPTSVISVLMFTRRLGLSKAMRRCFTNDQFYERHGRFYETAIPMTDYARKHMNRLWNGQQVSHVLMLDTAFAAYYATLVCPFAVDAWLILLDLHQRGIDLEIDGRDHAAEGISNAEQFLRDVHDADPQFRDLLTAGIKQLRQVA